RKKKPKRERDFDRRLWSRFWKIARPYWFGSDRWVGRGLIALLVVLLVGRTEFNVLFNQQSGELTSALAARDSVRFWHAMRIFGGALLVGVPVYAIYYYVRDRLGIAWRRWLTTHFLEEYFSNRAFYELNANVSIDNPDQRISEDIRAFTQKSLTFLLELVSAVLTLIAFSGVLWAISKTLVGILVVYALLGSILTFAVFGKPLIGLNFSQLRREADFRFGLIRVRENAEAIAFYGGEGRESAHVLERFAALYENYKRLLKRTLGLNLFQYAYTFITYALPSIVIAPRIISGELEVGRAVQAGGAFAAMLGALTVFVDNFEALSAFAAGIERLHTFKRALHEQAHRKPGAEEIQSVAGPDFALQNVTLKTPGQGRVLAADISLKVASPGGLVIVGASGGGKSSLLRAIAGLWRSGSGTIRRPELSEMLFLPQRPYMILGTLRHQLLYPNTDAKVDDAALAMVLERVNLQHLVERCGGFDTEIDFAKILSIGEQQRLTVARVLLARPKVAVLDEATSALDGENETMLYEELRRTNATLISVTHHPTVIKHHSHVLELGGDGTWQVSETANYSMDPELEEVDDLGSSVVRAPSSQHSRSIKPPPVSSRRPVG
ncbi:MAG TPA: ABC transporter ATP-binding protein/permease, partial [Polyangiaceae bacterium]|nr:ABC transporter ATP-binding protein/permease [Polyangiaceae bacterium]